MAYKTGIVVTGDAKGGVKAVKLTAEELKKLNQVKKKSVARAREYGKAFLDVSRKAAKYAAVGTGVVLAAVSAMVKAELGHIDALAKTSDKLGIQTEKLTELRYAAELTGLSGKQLDDGLQRMTRRLSEAAHGTGVAKDALKELNLDANELNRLSPDKAFAKIADAMNKVEGQGDRVRLAFKLFDKEGVGLVNTLKLGSEGFEEVARKADIAGINLSRIDAAKVEMANDAMLDASKLMDGFAKQITVKVAPVIQALASELFGVAEEAGGVGEAVSKSFGYGVKAVGVFADGIHGIKIIFKGLSVLSAKFFNHFAQQAAYVDTLITKLLNKLPGFMGGGDYTESSVIQGIAQSLQNTGDQLASELDAMLQKALPSERLQEFVSDVERKATRAAKVVAEQNEVVSLSYEEAAAAASKVVEQNKAAEKAAAAQKDSAKAYADAWGEATKRIDSSFSNSWRTMLKDGKLNFDEFKDSIVGSFKDLLANLAHQAITKPILVQLGLGGGGSVPGLQSILGGGSGSGSGLDLSSIVSGISNIFSSSSVGSGIATGVLKTGGFLGLDTGFGSVLGDAANNLSLTTNAAMGLGGIGGGLLSGALGLSGEYSGITGGIGTALGSAFLTPILGPLAPFVGSFLGDALGGLFGNKKPSNKEGNASVNWDTDQVTLGGQTGKKFSQENRDAAGALAANISGMIGALELLSGNQSQTNFTVGVGDRDGKYLNYQGPNDATVQRLTTTDDPEALLAAAAQHFAAELQIDASIFTRLQRSGEVITDTIQRVVSETYALHGSLEQLGLVEAFGAESAQITQALIEQAGGADALAAGASKFYEAFYTEEEKFASFSDSLIAQFQAINIEVPESREAFRELVESIDVTTASGQKQLAQLLSITPAMDRYYTQLKSVKGATDEAAQGVENLAANVIKLAASNARQSLDLIGAVDRFNGGSSIDQQIAAEEAGLQSMRSAESGLYQAQEQRYQSAMEAEKALQGFRDSLLVGSNSILTNQEKEAEAKRQFEEALRSGDVSQATSAASTYLDQARANHASGDQFRAVFGEVNQQLAQMQQHFGSVAPVSGGGVSSGAVSSAKLDELRALQEEQNDLIRNFQAVVNAEEVAKQIGLLGLASNADVFELAEKFGLDIEQLAAVFGVNVAELDDSMIGAISSMAEYLKIDNAALLEGLGADLEKLPQSFRDQLGSLELASEQGQLADQQSKEQQVQVLGEVVEAVTSGNQGTVEQLQSVEAAIVSGNEQLAQSIAEQISILNNSVSITQQGYSELAEQLEDLKRRTDEQTGILEQQKAG